jgi:Domain of Unknown Function (DUF1259)
VNPVVRTLRAHGIEVTAIHSHTLTDQPRLFYLHFWAHDEDAVKLAQGLRAALDLTTVASKEVGRGPPRPAPESSMPGRPRHQPRGGWHGTRR